MIARVLLISFFLLQIVASLPSLACRDLPCWDREGGNCCNAVAPECEQVCCSADDHQDALSICAQDPFSCIICLVCPGRSHPLPSAVMFPFVMLPLPEAAPFEGVTPIWSFSEPPVVLSTPHHHSLASLATASRYRSRMCVWTI